MESVLFLLGNKGNDPSVSSADCCSISALLFVCFVSFVVHVFTTPKTAGSATTWTRTATAKLTAAPGSHTMAIRSRCNSTGRLPPLPNRPNRSRQKTYRTDISGTQPPWTRSWPTGELKRYLYSRKTYRTLQFVLNPSNTKRELEAVGHAILIKSVWKEGDVYVGVVLDPARGAYKATIDWMPLWDAAMLEDQISLFVTFVP